MKNPAYLRAPNYKIRPEPFGAIAMDMTGERRLCTLNPLGLRILTSCDATPADLDTILAAARAANAEIKESSVRAFVDAAEASGLLVRVSGASASTLHARPSARVQSDAQRNGQLFLSAPYEIDLYGTTRCNVACAFCYLPREVRDLYAPERMPEQLFWDILDQALAADVFGINFLGGEPFEYLDLIREAITRYKGKFLFSVTTNGTLIEKYYGMTEFLNTPGVGIQVSVHSSNPDVHDKLVQHAGAFDAAIKGASLLASAGVKVSIQSVITRANSEHDIMELLRIARSIGARAFRILVPYPGTHMSLRQYKNLLFPPPDFLPIARRLNEMRVRDRSFGIYVQGAFSFVDDETTPPVSSPLETILLAPQDGLVQLSVLPDGAVHPGSVQLDGKSPPMGYLGQSNLQTIWAESNREIVRRSRAEVSEPCSSCPHFEVCGGGHAEMSQNLFGDPTIGDLRCSRVWRAMEAGVLHIASGTAKEKQRG